MITGKNRLKPAKVLTIVEKVENDLMVIDPAASFETCADSVRRYQHPARPTNSGNQQKGMTPMTTTAIEVHGLRKSYGGKIVLDDVDLTVSAGTVTALLGPNGAGKTTTVQILATLVLPDGGTAFVNGCDAGRFALRDGTSLLA